jgi:hypothetical protein
MVATDVQQLFFQQIKNGLGSPSFTGGGGSRTAQYQ